MALKIETYTSFNEALKQSGELSFEMTVELLSRMSCSHVLELLKTKVTQVAHKQDGEKLAVLLQMVRQQYGFVCAEELVHKPFQYAHDRQRAAEREAVVRFRGYLAELFWQLPDSRCEQLSVRDQDGSRYDDGHATRQALPETKRFIFRELLSEWTSEPTTQSVYAFRRAIAMGWPLSDQFKHKLEGEHDIELAARGRYISTEEKKQYVAAIRTHLDGFDSFETRQKGADAIYGPWLAQQRVPDDILKVLVMARAKMGGIESARRDVSNAALMEGIPESGVALIRIMTGNMREWVADAQDVIAEIVTAQRKRNPYWRGNTIPHTLTFNTQNVLTLEFVRCQDADDQFFVLVDANGAIKNAKEAGRFANGCTVRLIVRQEESTSEPLTNTWFG